MATNAKIYFKAKPNLSKFSVSDLSSYDSSKLTVHANSQGKLSFDIAFGLAVNTISLFDDQFLPYPLGAFEC